MKYLELKKLQARWRGKICLFGAGMIGSTWAYDLLTAAGFPVDFYCDNQAGREGAEVNGVEVVPAERLYEWKSGVLVFITTAEKSHPGIRRQLEENGVGNIVEAGFLFLQEFIESLAEIEEEEIKERFHSIVDDAEYVGRQYRYYTGRDLDLGVPETFNEKIQWLKLYDRRGSYTQMVDKHEAKRYVAREAGEEYTVPTLGVFQSFDEIDFGRLPDQFVLKCTHDSGSVVACREKSRFDRAGAKRVLEPALERNYYWRHREWPYKNVRPRIIAEKYLEEPGGELKDYKFFCFDGKAELIQVDFDRFSGHKRNLYTTDWEYVDAVIKYPNSPEKKIARPQKLGEMVRLAEKLSRGIPHVRVDLYCVGRQIYFGEFTFHHGGGYEEFTPGSLGYRLGSRIPLNPAAE